MEIMFGSLLFRMDGSLGPIGHTLKRGGGGGDGDGSSGSGGNKEEDDHSICAICLEPLSDRTVVQLRCRHLFHLDCIGSAFNYKNRMQCPVCRNIEEGDWFFANPRNEELGLNIVQVDLFPANVVEIEWVEYPSVTYTNLSSRGPPPGFAPLGVNQVHRAPSVAASRLQNQARGAPRFGGHGMNQPHHGAAREFSPRLNIPQGAPRVDAPLQNLRQGRDGPYVTDASFLQHMLNGDDIRQTIRDREERGSNTAGRGRGGGSGGGSYRGRGGRGSSYSGCDGGGNSYSGRGSGSGGNSHRGRSSGSGGNSHRGRGSGSGGNSHRGRGGGRYDNGGRRGGRNGSDGGFGGERRSEF